MASKLPVVKVDSVNYAMDGPYSKSVKCLIQIHRPNVNRHALSSSSLPLQSSNYVFFTRCSVNSLTDSYAGHVSGFE